MPIWTSAFLADKFAEGEKIASRELRTLLARTSLSVTSGTATYELPENCIGISRVTYKGVRLTPVTFGEITQRYGPVLYGSGEIIGAFDDTSFSSVFNIDVEGTGKTPTGRPTYFIYDTLGYKNITLFPIPGETVADTTDNLYLGSTIRDRVIVEYVRTSDSAVTLPEYIRNPLCKYYTLYKTFATEGKGQDLTASAMYKELFDIYLAKSKALLQKQFKCHKHELDPIEQANAMFGKPRLPWNYGTVIR